MVGPVARGAEPDESARTLLRPGASASPRPGGVTSRTRLCQVLVLLTIVQAAFGGNAVISSYAMTDAHVDPVVFSLLRDVGGATLLLAACRLTSGTFAVPAAEHVGWFVLLGVLGVYMGQMFFVVALQFVPPTTAALVQQSQPVLTALFAALLRIEPLRLRTPAGALRLGGIGLAVAGAALALALKPSTPTTTVSGRYSAGKQLLGNAFLIAQAVAGALYQLVQKRLLSLERYPPLAVAAWCYAFGACAVALTVPLCKLDASSWAIPRGGGLAVAYAIFITSAFNYGAQATPSQRG